MVSLIAELVLWKRMLVCFEGKAGLVKRKTIDNKTQRIILQIKTKFKMNTNIDPARPYRRIEIDKVFAKVKAGMQVEALLKGKSKGLNKALYQDIYTGQELIGGDPYDYEHIRSSEGIHAKYKSILTNDQIALVVNCPENVGVTLTFINKSKGKRKMEDWMSIPANVVINGIDLKLTLANLKKADKKIEYMVREFKCFL